MTAREEGVALDGTLALCQYHTNGFAHHELEAIAEYRRQVSLRPYFDLEELLQGATDLDTALRGRAEELARWHEALTDLMNDPRLENERRRTRLSGPPFDEHGKGPYPAAVARYLSFAAEDYHNHRAGYEYAITVRALARLHAAVTYPPETRRVDFNNKALSRW
ncbi:hypothetical protein O1L60_44950 [Streptomyces diastatochromogenes]|nr:hypothetical protein [Streptomyces diastatochromogenes]